MLPVYLGGRKTHAFRDVAAVIPALQFKTDLVRALGFRPAKKVNCLFVYRTPARSLDGGLTLKEHRAAAALSGTLAGQHEDSAPPGS